MGEVMRVGEAPSRGVLVVEDDDGLRSLIVKSLGGAGFDARGVPNGAEAIEHAAADPSQVLLLDQKLPDMTGRDVLHALSRRGIQAHFIIMTGQGDERLAVEMMKLGAADYLVKDLDLTDRLPRVLARAFHAIETEQKLRAAEEMQRESEERHRLILQTAMSGFWMADMEGRLLEVNESYCRMSGYSEQELLALHISDVEAIETQTNIAAHIHQVIMQGQGRFESRHRRKDGSTYDVEVSAQYQPSGGGRVVVFLNDITERKRAEQALRESEARYRNIVQTATEGIWGMDAQRVTTFVNARMAEMMGYEPAEMIGKAVDAFMFDEDISDLQGKTPERDTEAQAYERRFRRKDGTTLWTIVSVSAWRDEADLRQGSFAMLTDITERKRAEEALKTAHNNQRAVMASSPVAIIVVGKDDQVIDANVAAEQIFGRPFSAVQGGRCGDFLGCVNRTQDVRGCGRTAYCPACPLLAAIRETQAKGKGCRDREMETLLETGGVSKRFWLRFSTEPVVLDNRRHVLVTLQDTSALRHVEQQHQNLFREMLDGFALHEIICDAQSRPIDYRFLSVNPAFERLTGLKADDLLGRTVLEVMPNTERVWIETYGRVALTGEPAHFEDYSVALDRQFEVKAFCPAPGQFACIFADVTKRKRAEEALRESEGRFRKLFEHTGSGVAIYEARDDGEDFVFVDLNLAGARSSKVARDEIIGQSVLKIFPGVREIGLFEIFQRVWRTGQPEMLPVVDYRDERLQQTVENYVYKLPSGEIVAVYDDVTDREKSARALWEQYKFLSTLIETIPSPIFYKDTEGRYTGCNRGFEEFLGRPRSEIIGKTAWDIIAPETADKYTQMDRDLLQHPGSQQYEWRIASTKEGVRDVIFNKATFVDAQGQLAGIIGVILDVTERKRAEEAIRVSRDLLNSVLENAPIRVFWKDKDLRFLGCNALFARDAGLSSQEDLIGKDDFQTIWREQAELYRADDQRVMDSDTPILGYEEPQVTPDGRTVWLRTSKVPLHDAHGKVFGILGIYEDITERKYAEESLRESEMLYVSLVEHLPQSVFRKDREGRFTFVNRLFTQTLGKTEKEILGKTDADLYPPEFAARCRLGDQRVMETGAPFEDEEIYQVQGGTPFTIHVVKTPLKDAEGNITGIQGLFWDVTDRILLEEQLRQAQKMEAIGTLAGGIAHDFNNILQSILVYAELTLDNVAEDSAAVLNVEGILTGAKRARDLVARILAFSRRSEVEFKPLTLQPILIEALKLLRGSLPSTIEIRQDIRAECRPVLADPTGIHQIIMNLCTNAYHAMRETGGVLDVQLGEVPVDAEMAELHPELQPGAYVQLTVSDTGPGIEPDVMTRMFDPYFTTKQVGEGSGLGLSVVHGIVQKLHGTIFAESVLGAGSTFTVLLPMCPETSTTPNVIGPHAPTPLSGTERIMIVDDEAPIARSIANALQKYGYTVEVCSSSLEARERFRAAGGRYDVVVTDQTMPHLTGIQLAADLLKIRADLPIILCTGYSDLVDEAKAKAAGVCEFLDKPFFPEVLAQAVRHALDAGSRGAQ